MLRLATDVDVHGAIVRGLRRRMPAIDLVRVQDALQESTPDPAVLNWAVGEQRILIANDRNTMIRCAQERIPNGLPMIDLVITISAQSIGATIADLLVNTECVSVERIRDLAFMFLPLPD